MSYETDDTIHETPEIEQLEKYILGIEKWPMSKYEPPCKKKETSLIAKVIEVFKRGIKDECDR